MVPGNPLRLDIRADSATRSARRYQRRLMLLRGNEFLKLSGSFRASGRIECVIGPFFLPEALILPDDQG
jgi:hypothetical protein